VRSGALTVSPEDYRKLLKLNEFEVAKKLSTVRLMQLYEFTPTSIFNNQAVIETIMNLFLKRDCIIEGFYLLSLIKRKHLQEDMLEVLLHNLQQMQTLERLEDNVLVTHWNPLAVCILNSEICERVLDWSNEYRIHFFNLNQVFLDLAFNLQKQFTFYSQLKAVYLERVFGKKYLIEIIAAKPDKFRLLLNHPLLASLIEELWNGPHAMSFGLDQASYVQQALKSRPANVLKSHAQKLQFVEMSWFQFYSWRHNGNVKLMFEAGLLIVAFVVMNYIYDVYTGIITDYQHAVDHLADPDSIVTIDEVFHKTQIVRNGSKATMYFFLLMAADLINQFLFKYFLQEHFRLNMRWFIDLFILGGTSFIYYILDHESAYDLDEFFKRLEYSFGVCIFLFVWRIFFKFLVYKSVGPIIRIIYMIILEISRYLMVYVVSLLSFAYFGYFLFFREGRDFSTLQDSIKTTLSLGLGNLDFGSVSERYEVGVAYVCIWVFFSSVILINLLIAVLSNTYESLSTQASADHIAMLYSYYSSNRYDPQYGALVMFPAPTQVLVLPFVPALMRYPAVNLYLCRVSYVPMFLLAILVFTVFQVAWVVPAYVWQSFKAAYELKYKLLVNFKRLFVWVFVGPWYLLVCLVLSYPQLYHYLMHSPPPPREVSSEALDSLSKIVKTEMQGKTGAVFMKLEELMAPYNQASRRANIFGMLGNQSQIFDNLSTEIQTKVVVNKAVREAVTREIIEILKRFLLQDGETVYLSLIWHYLNKFEGSMSRLCAININYNMKTVVKLHSSEDSKA
jgi:hypothetical protein